MKTRSKLYFFRVVDRTGAVKHTGSSYHYTSLFVEATDLAHEIGGYWETINFQGRIIDGNIPTNMEVTRDAIRTK